MTQPHSSSKPPTPDRAALRKTLIGLRRNADAALRQRWDGAISQQLLDWCLQHRPGSLGVFWPIQAEPDLLASYPLLQEMGIQLALPLVQAKAAPLLFLEWAPGQPMDRDEYGIPVPSQREKIIAPEVLLIPCVGFNAARFRLGYGGGFYDRTLAQQPRPTTLGIAYQLAQTEFTEDAHDVAMDGIITELGIFDN